MKIRYIISSFITTAIVGLSALGGVAQAAGSASYSLTPSSGSYVKGASFTTTVYETSAEAVNTVQADLTFDAAKLQFVSVSTSGSPFTTCTQSSGGNGRVGIVCTKLGGAVTGKQKVGAVNFKAKTSSGSSKVSVAQSSMIVSEASSKDIWNHANVSTNYTFKAAPVATPPPAPAPAPAVEPAVTEVTTPVTTPTSDTTSGPVVANNTGRNVALSAAILAAVAALMYFRKSIPVLKSLKMPVMASAANVKKPAVKKSK